MTELGSVLIVDDDDSLRESLMRNLDRLGMRVHGAASVDDARVSLEMLDFDVLVTDLRMVGADGIDLLRAAREISPRTRSILMSAFASARDHELATELGAVCVLPKPFTPNDLREAIEHALESRSGFRGRVHGLSLIDMLQMFHYGKRSISVLLSGRVGAVHVDGGEIVHAQWSDLGGEEALARILSVDSGSLRTRPLVPVERSIHRPFCALLLDMLRLADESSSGTVAAPTTEDPTTEDPSAGDASAGDSGAWDSDAGDSDAGDSDAGDSDAGDSSAGTPLDDDGDIQGSLEPEGARSEETSWRWEVKPIDDVCKQVVERTNGGVACGIVDLDTARLLGVHNSGGYSQTLNEIVAAAAMDLFRGPNVNRVQESVRAQRGTPEEDAHCFEEIHVSSKHNYHFMKTVKSGKAVIVLVTKKTTSVRVGWAMLESVMGDIELHVP